MTAVNGGQATMVDAEGAAKPGFAFSSGATAARPRWWQSPAVPWALMSATSAAGAAALAWLAGDGGDGAVLAFAATAVLGAAAAGWLIARSEGATPSKHWSNAPQPVPSLFDSAPVGIVFLDTAGVVTDCNRAFLKAVGHERNAVVERPLADHIAQEDQDDVTDQLSKLVMGTARFASLDGVRVIGRGTRELSVSLHASRLEDGDELSGFIAYFLDATEQRNLELQFAQAQKMQAVGQLAGGIAHDFNNLLTAMLGFSDLLLTRHDVNDPSYEDIRQIRNNALRASHLVRQLLAFSRKQTLKPVVMDVADAMAELSLMLGRLLGATIELRLQSSGGPGLVRVDPSQLDQVIINLAVNARDAMPGGGVLTIATSRVALSETVHRGAEVMARGEYVIIEVTDTGVGISKEVIGSIFEPFFSTKEVGEGTGLGLSTVYGIVRQTEGFIFVDSAPGRGSTFTIYLPAVAAAAAAPAPAPATAMSASPSGIAVFERRASGAGTVLLVEDEDAVRTFAARALSNKGYRVIEAVDGESALDVLADQGAGIDLVVTDIVMPGMDGCTLVRLARREMAKVKVILMSGYAENSLVGELEQDPTITFLPKPFTLADLVGKVQELMAA